MTNKEYLKQELPLWLFNRLVPNSRTDDDFTTINYGRDAFDYASTKDAAKISVVFGRWKSQEETMADIFKRLWSENKNFLFPCTLKEALSILELVEPEFYQFLNARKRNPKLISTVNKWFGTDSAISLSIQPWDNTLDGISYWKDKTDFSLSPQWIAERTVVCKAKPEPKTIGEWLELTENALIKEIAEFDHKIHDKQHILVEKLTKDLSDLFYDVPTGGSQVYNECKSQESFQPYIDWYERHPKNPKNVASIVALKDIDEEHSIEWWRDELAKTEPEVAEHLYQCYVFHGRTHQTPNRLYGSGPASFLGGVTWSDVGRHFGILEDVYANCESQKSMQPLKEALAAKNATVKISVVVDSVSSEMPGATFPCTIQERIDWMLTQPKLKPVAEYIIREGVINTDQLAHGEFSNQEGRNFSYICTNARLIDRECNHASSWEPFFDKFPHLRVKTVKPVELKITREHRQLLVECANIKEVKQLLKHINQESAFTHSARLVVFYDLDERKAYHVGNTKKSQWKQIPNKVHKKVSVEYFLTEVPNLMLDLASDKKPRLGASERFQEIFGLPVVNLPISTSSWFDNVPAEPKVNTKSWFD